MATPRFHLQRENRSDQHETLGLSSGGADLLNESPWLLAQLIYKALQVVDSCTKEPTMEVFRCSEVALCICLGRD